MANTILVRHLYDKYINRNEQTVDFRPIIFMLGCKNGLHDQKVILLQAMSLREITLPPDKGFTA
jgi:hypothetical protein